MSLLAILRSLNQDSSWVFRPIFTAKPIILGEMYGLSLQKMEKKYDSNTVLISRSKFLRMFTPCLAFHTVDQLLWRWKLGFKIVVFINSYGCWSSFLKNTQNFIGHHKKQTIKLSQMKPTNKSTNPPTNQPTQQTNKQINPMNSNSYFKDWEQTWGGHYSSQAQITLQSYSDRDGLALA